MVYWFGTIVGTNLGTTIGGIMEKFPLWLSIGYYSGSPAGKIGFMELPKLLEIIVGCIWWMIGLILKGFSNCCYDVYWGRSWTFTCCCFSLSSSSVLMSTYPFFNLASIFSSSSPSLIISLWSARSGTSSLRHSVFSDFAGSGAPKCGRRNYSYLLEQDGLSEFSMKC